MYSTFKNSHLVKVHIAATLRGLILAVDGPWEEFFDMTIIGSI